MCMSVQAKKYSNESRSQFTAVVVGVSLWPIAAAVTTVAVFLMKARRCTRRANRGSCLWPKKSPTPAADALPLVSTLAHLHTFILQLRAIGWLTGPKQHIRCNALSPHIKQKNINTRILSQAHIIKSIHHEAHYVFIMSAEGKDDAGQIPFICACARSVVLSKS